jgi:PAS domain S-box-containing protein
MKRALIVDDIKENLYLLEALLKAYGFITATANNGAEALGLALKDPPDIIIADILMPVMDGYTLCREWKKDDILKYIPFVFYTATYTHPKDGEFALSLGADRFIIKPQEPEDFMSIIEQVLSEFRNGKIQVSQTPESSEVNMLKEYNETLIRKMEDRMLKSEEAEKKIRIYASQLESEIEQRKQIAQTLKESEEKYRSIFENSGIGILLTSPEGRIFSANDFACKLFGRTEEEIILLGRDGLVDHTDPNLQLLLDERKRIGHAKGELTFIRKDGSKFLAEVSSVIFQDKDGNERTSMVIRDLTEQKKAEEALQKNEAMLSLILNSIPQSIFWKDRNSIYLGSNKVFAKAAGFEDPSLLIGKSDFDLPWRQEESEAYRKDDKEVIETQEPKIHIIETQHQHDGKQVWVDTTKIPLKDIHNTGYGVLGIYEDITEQKKAQEALKESELRFRILAESSPVGIFTTNAKGSTTYVNQRWCEISKLSFEDAMGDGWLKAIHPDDRDNLIHDWKQSTLASTDSKAEYRFIHPDGSVAWVIGQAVPKRSEKGCITGYIGTITDITERKKMEADLIFAKEKAEESDRLKSAFLANMSHEIRTPMNGILGFAELLKEPDLTGEQQQDYIEIIEKSGFRMLNIINDIVDISKIESGQMKVSISETDINKQIEYLFAFFKTEAESKGIKFSFKNNFSGLQERIKTDREKLYAILTNLIKNAIKYTDTGSIEFGVSTSSTTGPVSEPAELLQFYVKDTGIGIPIHRQKAIFERFIQADITDKEARQGAGLGLSIAKAYVEMLGGTIWVESESGIGSTFYFTIPYLTDSTEKYPFRNEDKSGVEKINSGILKTLIVEDDEGSAKFISIAIRKISNQIVFSRTGIEAVEVCHNNPDIDLILMDIQMPEMDGYEATRQIRQFNPEVIIIAQTAFALSDDREKAIAAGCNDYISKPIKIDKLKEMILKNIKM